MSPYECHGVAFTADVKAEHTPVNDQWLSVVVNEEKMEPSSNCQRYYASSNPAPYPLYRINSNTGETSVQCMKNDIYYASIKYYVHRFGCLTVKYEGEIAFDYINIDVSAEEYRRKVHFNRERTYATHLTCWEDGVRVKISDSESSGSSAICSITICKHGPVQARGSPYATCALQLLSTYLYVEPIVIKSTVEATSLIRYPEHTFHNFNDFDTHTCYWNMTMVYRRTILELWITLRRPCKDVHADERRFSGKCKMNISCITPITQEDFADVHNALYHYYRFMVDTDDGLVEPLMSKEKMLMFEAAMRDLDTHQVEALFTLRLNYWRPQPECSSAPLAELAKVGGLYAYSVQDVRHGGKVHVKDTVDYVDSSLAVASHFAYSLDYIMSPPVARKRLVCHVIPSKRVCRRNEDADNNEV